MENLPNDVNFLDDQGQHEFLMEAMLAKASTPLYDVSTISMLSTILF
jgi:hypothetical protein